MQTKRLISAALAAVSLAAATGCPKAQPTDRTDVFVYARGSDSKRLDPQTVNDGESILVISQIFEGLVQYDEGAGFEPVLATEWKASNGGRTWTFTLRKGVTFHNGEPFDAEAVRYTFARILDPEHPLHEGINNAALFADIERVEVASPHEVRFHLRRPVSAGLFLGSLTVYTALIVPPKAIAEMGADAFASRPIGTGPYRLTEWKDKERIVLEAYADHWAGPPPTKKVRVIPIEANASRRQQLEVNEVQGIDGISPIDLEALETNPDIRVLEQPGMSVGYLAMNTKKGPLQSVDLRRAIALAVDRDKIVKLNFQGHATPARQVTPESVLPPAAGLEVQKPNLEAARALMKKAGFEGGVDLELWAMPNPRPYFPEPKKTAEILKEDLAKIGVRAKIVTHDWNQYLDMTQRGEHDLCLLGWTLDVMDPDNTLFVFFASGNQGDMNVSFFGDPEVDRLLVEAQALGDEAKRRAIYQKVEAMIRDLAPLVPIVHPTQLGAVRSNVEGFELHPTGRRLFRGVRLK